MLDKTKRDNRIKVLRGKLQKMAYDGMGKFRGKQDYRSITNTHQSEVLGNYLQNDFMEKETRDNILGRKHIDISDPYVCQDEATCGPSTGHIYDKYKDLKEDMGGVAEAKPVAGVYTGPGAEHSTAAFKADDGKDSVGHTWFELPDESIVDASAGQFINPKYQPLTQSKRFRIIPKESGLHKYYKKDKSLSETIKKDMDSKMSEVARKLRKKGIDPFASRRKQLKGKLQKMAIDYKTNWKTHGADMDAIRAFKSKEVYSSGENHPSGSKFKFRSDGKSLFLHDYEVARHHKDGIEVSNAGYDSPLTYKTHQALGINSKGHAKHPKGLITLGSKEIDKNSGEWVLVNHADISEEPIIPDTMRKNQKARADGTFVERKKPKRETAEQASFRERATQKELKEQGKKGGKPLSKVNIQKTDQRIINAITGLNTPLPTDKRGQAAHHLLSYSGDGDIGKKLGLNKKDNDDENNSIMLPHDYHDFISHYNTSNPKTNLDNLRQMDSKIKQLKGKLQKIAAKGDIIQPIIQKSRFTELKDHTILSPKTFLDLSSSSGRGENSGKTTGLHDVHSGGIGHSDDTDSDIKHNPILGIKKDDRDEMFKKRDERRNKGDYNVNERGDELGTVERYKRQLRRQGVIAPFLSIRDNKITGHEGRHRARAMLEEGITETPVEITDSFYSNDSGTKRTQKEIDNVIPQDNSRKPIQKDTRAPIFGRYSKLKGRLQKMAETDPYKRVIGKPGINRKEELQKDDGLPPKSYAMFDEDFAEGIPDTRVETFSGSPDSKIIEKKDVEDNPKRYTLDDIGKRGSEAINTDKGLFEKGESELSRKLEDLRINRISIKETGIRENLGDLIKRKYIPKYMREKSNEPKVSGISQGVITTDLAKRLAKLQKIATDINRSPVDNNMSKSDEIINSFGNSGLSIEGVDGIYDTKNHKVLDGYNQEDIPRIREIYGEGVFIGTNSETDTRDGPNTNDLERTRKELQAIEDKGGIPALGFDSTEGGSLEALNVAITDSKEKVMDALYDNQWGTYIISPNNSSEIIENPKYTGRNK